MIRRLIDWALAKAVGVPSDPGSRAIDKMVEAVRSAGRPCIPPPPPASNPRQEFPPWSENAQKILDWIPKQDQRPCIPPPPPASNPRQEFRAGCRPWNQRRPGASQKELREQLEYLIDVHGEDALCRRLAEAAARRASERKH